MIPQEIKIDATARGVFVHYVQTLFVHYVQTLIEETEIEETALLIPYQELNSTFPRQGIKSIPCRRKSAT